MKKVFKPCMAYSVLAELFNILIYKNIFAYFTINYKHQSKHIQNKIKNIKISTANLTMRSMFESSIKKSYSTKSSYN